MKSKLLLVSLVLAAIIAVSMMPMPAASADPVPSFAEPTLLDNVNVAFGIDPVKEQCFGDWDWCELPEGTVPFNVDMVDAEKVCYDGEGIYVAVLDTGILTDWMNFFPPC